MKRILAVSLVAAFALPVTACGPKAGGSSRGGKSGGPQIQVDAKSVTRKSSSTNPQAVASFKEGVKLLDKIRKEGVGSYDDAIAKLNGAVALDSDFAEAWYNLGVIYEDLGRYDKAEDSFYRAAKANPELGEAMASLGRVYMIRGNVAKAKEFFNNRLVKDPKNKELRNKLAEALRLEKNHDGAIDQIKQVLTADPDNVEAYKTLALVFMDQGKYDLAKLTCANALKIDENNAGVYNNLGLIYLKQKDIRGAAAQFTLALEKDPGYAPALANLGAIALDHKDYKLAAECFGKLAKIKPSNPQALTAYAVTLRGMGKNEEAKALYMRVHALDKGNCDVSFNLGVLHQKGMQDYPTAIRYYQDYIQRCGVTDPKHQVYSLMKLAEDRLKAQQMMNAPAPAPKEEPPADVAQDKEGAEGATPPAEDEKTKAEAGKSGGSTAAAKN